MQSVSDGESVLRASRERLGIESGTAMTKTLVRTIASALWADMELDWPKSDEARTIHHFRGAHHTFAIRANDREYQIILADWVWRMNDAEGLIVALRELDWISAILAQRRIFIEIEESRYVLGPLEPAK